MYENVQHFLQTGWDLRYLLVVIAVTSGVVTHYVGKIENGDES